MLLYSGNNSVPLDLTNPTSFDQTKVMWERNETARVDLPEVAPVNDLGYTFGKPQIGRMKDIGRWARFMATVMAAPTLKLLYT